MATMIKISDEAWEILNSHKQRGESFDDVIIRTIKKKETNENDK